MLEKVDALAIETGEYRGLGQADVTRWNDEPGRTFQEVLELFGQQIEDALAREENDGNGH